MLSLGRLCFVENIDIWLVSIFKISSAPLLRTHLNVSLVASFSCVSGQRIGGRVGSGRRQLDALQLPCDNQADTQKALFATVLPFSLCIFLLCA